MGSARVWKQKIIFLEYSSSFPLSWLLFWTAILGRGCIEMFSLFSLLMTWKKLLVFKVVFEVSGGRGNYNKRNMKIKKRILRIGNFIASNFRICRFIMKFALIKFFVKCVFIVGLNFIQINNLKLDCKLTWDSNSNKFSLLLFQRTRFNYIDI